ncbi:MAG TPA: YihY/virulence factor BrkB family protein [Bacteroidales bacterium]|jgi:membrane protein|nr:YihY/virulence factor BrkB family protein [Bacteroidales bacterium]
MKKFFKSAKGAYKEWMAKDPFRESAVIAYYAIFSLPGLFVVIITLAGWFFGRDAVNQQVMGQISAALGQDTGEQIQNIISKQQNQTQNTSIWGTIIGILTLLLGATGVFVQFQKSLNIIWEVKADPKKSGIIQLLKARLFSFGLIVAIAFLLMVSLLVSTMLTAFGDWLSGKFSDSLLVVLKVVNFIISMGILTFLFALMLKVFPDAKIKWRDVWIGSFVTALLFILGRFALSLYFGKANPGSVFGAAGSIILVLLWVSYSSMIVFYGAEFTRQYADLNSGGAQPSEHAVKEKDPCADGSRKMTEAVKSRATT